MREKEIEFELNLTNSDRTWTEKMTQELLNIHISSELDRVASPVQSLRAIGMDRMSDRLAKLYKKQDSLVSELVSIYRNEVKHAS